MNILGAGIKSSTESLAANRPLKILMVDDDPAFTALLGTHLRAAGYEVATAQRVKAAREILSRTPLPDLLVVDGLLPDANGIDFIAEVRSQHIRVPIIFLSAFWHDRTTFLQLTKQHGVEAVLHKPILPQDFLKKVQALLGCPIRTGAALPETDTPLDLGFEDELENMRLEFVAKLGPKLNLIVERLGTARAECSLAAIQELQMMVHKLRGTAGMFGFAEISDMLAQAERWIVEVSGNLAEILRLAGPLDSILRKAIRSAARPAGPMGGKAGALAPSRVAILVTGDRALADALACADLAADIEIRCVPSLRDASALLDISEPVCALLVHMDRVDDERFQADVETLKALGAKFPVSAGVVTPNLLSPRRHAELLAAGLSFELQEQSSVTSIHKAIQYLVGLGSTRRIRVMLVDDDADFCRLQKKILEHAGLEVVVCTEPIGVWDQLEAAVPDLILLDENMPGIKGMDLCGLIRNVPRWSTLPIFLFTADAAVKTKVDAFRKGVSDYLVKGIDSQELVARISSRVLHDRQLTTEADTDLLTGVLNRRAFVQQAEAALHTARRQNGRLAVCMLDLDKFKSINDQFGHAAGDQVLSGFGRLLRERFRTIDLRGRLGGEEFAVVFPHESKQSALLAMRRLLTEFAAAGFKVEGANAFTASFSAGIAEFPDDGNSIESLLYAADQRLLCAKRAGRQRIEADDRQVVSRQPGPASGRARHPFLFVNTL